MSQSELEKSSVPEMQLQLLEELHIPSLMKLEEEAFPVDHWSEEAMRTEFLENPDGFRIIKTNEEILAYIQFQVGYDRLDITGSANDGIIASIAVAIKARRKGLGELLMTEAMDSLKAQHTKRVILHTRASNAEMKALCSKMGLEQVGEIESYYSDKENALALAIQLEK